MARTKTVQMPAGIRNKLMASIAMLLVSSIMMVSTTYAWFTLSTAPEVTGITTSVGANGNLEMALLNGTTFTDLNKITSAVGDSSAAKAVTAANITWGNLVDLSDASYGLQNISLQPARLNVAHSTTGETTTYTKTQLQSVTNLLLTPTYGADGRVDTLEDKTYAAANTSTTDTASWKYDSSSLTYGVRAIGTSDNMTAQQAGLLAAKSTYTSNLYAAQSTMQEALSANGSKLADAIMVLATSSATTLTDTDQQDAIKALITASENALKKIDAAYKQVLLAYAASQLSNEALYNAAVAAIDGAASASDAVTAFKAVEGVSVTTTPIDSALTDLTTQQGNVAAAKTAVASSDYKTALSKLVDTNSENVEISGYKISEIKDDSGAVKSAFMIAAIENLYVYMGEGSGLFAYVGSVAGNYSATCTVAIQYNGETFNRPATLRTTATEDIISLGTMSAASASGGTSDTYLSDTYGYALDFAFRTNAAGSYLKLQTEAAQRVYSDGTSEVTQGSGSNMTFQVSKDKANKATLNDTQVAELMQAIRVAFVDPGSGVASETGVGTIYGIATLDNITGDGTGSYTGKLTLKDWDVTDGKLTVSPKTGTTETDKLMNLDQNTAKRLTVIVYLDGDIVDNSKVANAAQSLTGSMNLQFASSAELVPMNNTALKNMTLTYTELKAAGATYKLNNTEYTVNEGYKLYKGNDGKVYYAQNVTGEGTPTYVELTVSNASVALTAKDTTPATPTTTYTAATLTEGKYTYNEKQYTVNEGYTIYNGSDSKVYFSNDGQTYTELSTENLTTALTEVSSEPAGEGD